MALGPKRNEEYKNMARYRGPKNRLARRERIDLGLKTPGSHAHAQLLKRLNVMPGAHGHRNRGKLSDFGTQLREKQKAKRIYGVLEKQFRNYYKKALKVTGNTGEFLLQQLECRLDNVLYRLYLAPTRTAARQMITHGHVQINNKKVTIPSYQVSIDEMIALTKKGMEIPSVKKLIDEKPPASSEWLERMGPVGKVLHIPLRTQIPEEINEQLIVEYYSR